MPRHDTTAQHDKDEDDDSPSARMCGESPCSSSVRSWRPVSRIVESLCRMQNADDGMRCVPVAHGSTCVTCDVMWSRRLGQYASRS